MSYLITKSDGTVLATVAAQSFNSTATSITLIGQGELNYGQYINNDLVHMVEHFAATTAPAHPLNGQLWWDSSVNIFRVYSAGSWVALRPDVPPNDAGVTTVTIEAGTTVTAFLSHGNVIATVCDRSVVNSALPSSVTYRDNTYAFRSRFPTGIGHGITVSSDSELTDDNESDTLVTSKWVKALSGFGATGPTGPAGDGSSLDISSMPDITEDGNEVAWATPGRIVVVEVPDDSTNYKMPVNSLLAVGSSEHVYILAGDGDAETNNFGGGINLAGGAGVEGGEGGNVSILSGDSESGNAGAISIIAGNSTLQGGGVTITTGSGGTTGVAGQMTLTAADGANGGIVLIEAGDAIADFGIGGDVRIHGGAAAGLGTGGAIEIIAGASTNVNGGPLYLSAGSASDTGGGGATQIYAGSGGNTSGSGGGVFVNGGSAPTLGIGGSATLAAGAGRGIGQPGGIVYLLGGSASGDSGAGGHVVIVGGAASGANSNGGTLDFSAGHATSGVGGGIALQSGSSSSGAGGAIQFIAGSSGGASGDGGNILIQSGTATATTGAGGDIYLGTPNAGAGGGRRGLLLIPDIPTADPHVAGAVWSNSNILTISTG